MADDRRDPEARPSPDALLGTRRQRFDDLGERLPRSLAARAHKAEAGMNLITSRLRPQLLEQKVQRLADKLASAAKMIELGNKRMAEGQKFLGQLKRMHPDSPLVARLEQEIKAGRLKVPTGF